MYNELNKTNTIIYYRMDCSHRRSTVRSVRSKEPTSRGAAQLPRSSNDEEQEEMELENEALKASEAAHGGEGRRLEPGVEAAT